MALEEYQRKRDFRKTPEPAGSRSLRKNPAAAPLSFAPLSFVVQQHRARRLHYDFRLELDGVLKSWALPKGPSLDPGEKRLAVQVEDHPIDYGGFEGVIPEGQYGGGTVLLWDRGTWTPLEPDAEAAYRQGALKFRLDGEKLHGSWALIRMGGKAAGAKGKGADRRANWLLIKERDEAAVPGSDAAVVEDNPLSVATGRSIEAIAADRDRVWEATHRDVDRPPAPPPPAPAPAAKPAPMPLSPNGGEGRVRGRRPIPGARKRAAMPDRLAPQLAMLVADSPDGEEWLHEVKFDGYRLLAHIDHGEVRLITRGSLDWTGKFPELAHALAELPLDTALIDGEVVALMPDDTSSFSALQNALSRGDSGSLVFCAFDLLYLDGYDLTGAALEQRKAALAGIMPSDMGGALRYSDHQLGRGHAFFAQACNFRLEGTVSKRRDRPYRPGRSADWLKIKCQNRDEFVVIGFTEPSGRRHGFGALILGYYDRDGGRLHYAGRCGTGFGAAQLADMRPALDRIERAAPPARMPKGASKKGVHWVEPRLVAEVRYTGWTADGILRHAAFLGLREDKPPEEVVYAPQSVGKAPAPEAAPHPADPDKARRATPPEGNRAPRVRGGEDTRADPTPARDGSVNFAGVRLTHPDRVFYPEAGISKLALARYYEAIQDWALPHLANRPLSLVRCPEGRTGECFYQKHIGSSVPDVVGRVAIAEKSATRTYPVIENLAGLIAMVQMGVLEIHPWGSTVAQLETPDHITFDFDPDVGLPWERVTEAAIAMREALLGIGLRSFAKTTGGKGLHVVVPVAPQLDWEAIEAFAKWVAERFVKASPDRFTANMAKRARAGGHIFIDYLRNDRGATAIGAYSPRARPGAPVATPLFWEEVENGVKPAAFTVATVPDRLAKLTSDPWADMPKLRQSISAKVRREAGI